MRWEVKKIYLLLTSVTRPDGSPVVDALVQGAVGQAMTDTSGYLQADIAPGAILTLNPFEGESCTVRLPEDPPEDDFMVLDQLVCR